MAANLNSYLNDSTLVRTRLEPSALRRHLALVLLSHLSLLLVLLLSCPVPALEQIRDTLTPNELALIHNHRKGILKKDPDAEPIYTASDLLRKELPPVKWIVSPFLPEGLALLAGKPKMGKSWLGLGLAVAVATGGKALGKVPVQEGDVLYLALEDNERRMQRRLRKILQIDKGAPMPNLDRLYISHMCPRIGQADGGAEEYIGSWLREHPHARLVIIDVLKRIRPTRRGGGNGYDDDYSDVEPLQRLASEYSVAILVLTHLRKADATDPLDTLNATLGLSGAADNVLVLTRERGQADAVLVGSGRDIEELDLALRFDAATALWSVLGGAEEYRLSEARKEIIDIMRNMGKPVVPKDLYPLLPNKKQATIRKDISNMIKDGDLIYKFGGYLINTDKYPNLDQSGEQGV